MPDVYEDEDEGTYSEATELVMSYFWSVNEFDDDDSVDILEVEGIEDVRENPETERRYVHEKRILKDIEDLQQYALDEGLYDNEVIDTKGGFNNPNILPKFLNSLRNSDLLHGIRADSGSALEKRFCINEELDGMYGAGTDLDYVHIGEVGDEVLRDQAKEIILNNDFPRNTDWQRLNSRAQRARERRS